MSNVIEALFGVAMFAMGFYAAAFIGLCIADELNVSRQAIRAALKRALRRW